MKVKWTKEMINPTEGIIIADDGKEKVVIAHVKGDTEEGTERNLSIMQSGLEMYVSFKEIADALKDKRQSKVLKLTIWEKAMLGGIEDLLKNIPDE